jgi:hypothetical protein
MTTNEIKTRAWWEMKWAKDALFKSQRYGASIKGIAYPYVTPEQRAVLRATYEAKRAAYEALR